MAFDKAAWSREYAKLPHVRKAKALYRKSAKRRATLCRYNRSAKRRATSARYRASGKSRPLSRAWKQNNQIKVKANAAVATALEYGRLQKRPCEICGCQDVEAHHDDYSKPLIVRWLCKLHHEQIHHQTPEVV